MMEKLRSSVVTAFFVFLFSVLFFAVSGSAKATETQKEGTLKAYGKLPLYFIENKGQLDPKVRFYVKTSGQTLYFTDEGIVFDLLRREETPGNSMEGAEKGRQPAGPKTERLVFNLAFENAQKSVLIKGLDRQAARVNYFIGNDRSKWKTGTPTYRGVVYKGVYKGIDLKVFGNAKDIEYEFIVNPGGHPDDILLTYNGIEGLTSNGEGELLIATAFGELKEAKPYVFQEMEGEMAIDGSFEIRRAADQFQNQHFSYGFQIASYDPSRTLIIDPNLSYSTFLGGSDHDWADGIAIDGSGNAYVTGETASSDFPTKNPYQGTNDEGAFAAFITKLSSSGNTLIYSTYLGGTAGQSTGSEIVVDGSGNAYVAGTTSSSDFPTKNPYQGTFGGGWWDVFITKLSSSGNTLIYSTYLGKSDFDIGEGISIDTLGNAYVTGETQSEDFPTKNPYQATFGGGSSDAFITKLSSSGNTLSYSTFLGGSSYDVGRDMAVDASGNAYVLGRTYSSNFPTKNPYQETRGGSYDAFIAKLPASGNTLVYSTYLGGSSSEIGDGIAVNASGNAYVTGQTSSSNFPTKDPYQATKAGSTDVFITMLSSSGSALSWSTYLGGNDPDWGYGIAIDDSGNAYVAGQTYSADFPTKNPYQGTYGGGYYDGFVTKFSDTIPPLYVSTDGSCGGKTPCYTSIQAAINAAGTGDVIRIAQGTYSESITLNESKKVTLNGGWDSSFSTQTSNTTIITAPSVPQGSLTLQMLTIEP